VKVVRRLPGLDPGWRRAELRTLTTKEEEMDKKTEKKRKKITERIAALETEVSTSLGKKDSRTQEIDVASHMRKIADLRAELSWL
jgi:hypothetical protein